GQLDTVALGVGQVDSQVRAVVRHALDARLRLDDANKQVGEVPAGGHKEGRVIQADCAVGSPRPRHLRKHEQVFAAGAQPGGTALAPVRLKTQNALIKLDLA